MNEWQPIETAPKDGESILGFNKGEDNLEVVHWDRRHYWVSSKYHSAILDWLPVGYDLEITHWMPLPEPPKSAHE